MDIINRRLTIAYVTVVGFMSGAVDRMGRDDRGQGSVEYVGIVLVVAALIMAVIGVMGSQGGEIGNAIVSKVSEAIDSIHN